MPVRKSAAWGKWLVSGPPLLYLLVFFAIPTLIMVLASFRTPGDFGGLAPLVDESGKVDLNVESYARFFTESVYAAGIPEVGLVRAAHHAALPRARLSARRARCAEQREASAICCCSS